MLVTGLRGSLRKPSSADQPETPDGNSQLRQPEQNGLRSYTGQSNDGRRSTCLSGYHKRVVGFRWPAVCRGLIKVRGLMSEHSRPAKYGVTQFGSQAVEEYVQKLLPDLPWCYLILAKMREINRLQLNSSKCAAPANLVVQGRETIRSGSDNDLDKASSLEKG